MIWERTGADFLLELGAFYVHWNAPPCPSFWVGWMGVTRHRYVCVMWGAEQEDEPC